MSSRNLESLLETLAIRIVEVPGEPIHHAFGGMQDSQHTRRTAAFCKVVDHLFANCDGARWKLNPIAIVRMHPVTLLSLKAEGLHRVIDASGQTGRDEVEVIGLVLILGIDRDRCAAGEDDRDSVCLESGTHEGGDLFQGRVFVDLGLCLLCRTHRGLPVRRGLRRSSK